VDEVGLGIREQVVEVERRGWRGESGVGGEMGCLGLDHDRGRWCLGDAVAIVGLRFRCIWRGALNLQSRWRTAGVGGVLLSGLWPTVSPVSAVHAAIDVMSPCADSRRTSCRPLCLRDTTGWRCLGDCCR